MSHVWLSNPIMHPDHSKDLESAAAAHEFGGAQLDRKGAEGAAYQAYKQKAHAEAIAHHAHAMRSAMANGLREDAEKHNALYGLHMKALGLNPSATPPPSATGQKSLQEGYASFRMHPADRLLISSDMNKSERETFFKYVDPDEVYLSGPESDGELAKALRSPMALEQLHGLPVRVYFNLHNRLFSVQHRGKVVAHLPEVSLEGVKFKVSEAGRQRVLNDQRKNVHAFVEGKFVHKPEGDHEHLSQGVTYNPYKYSSFVRTHDKSPITAAQAATMKNIPHPTITVHEVQTQDSDPSFIHKRGQKE
ncbi:hypothetical protein [Myxococcus phage Mx1]|nr:hypothetical protein [Myxococcus phage Mx1]